MVPESQLSVGPILNDFGLHCRISRIESVPVDAANSHLSMLYFYGLDDQGHDKIVRIWFYSSRMLQEQELNDIRLNFPHIPIV
ncbi:hypothetical protein [Salmonirosea aquatica]|uniref:Uncharacterized protein n=1 Tax=Salmonirosea aquatica TaxID=2654236 RepID=A0A7C9B8Y8_9BACT|nr:hypothetical protein [Cytophagaceae bacterium SJW1-29]